MPASAWSHVNSKRAYDLIVPLRRRVAEDNGRGLGTLFSILEKLANMSDQELLLHLDQAHVFKQARERVMKPASERTSLADSAACGGTPVSLPSSGIYR